VEVVGDLQEDFVHRTGRAGLLGSLAKGEELCGGHPRPLTRAGTASPPDQPRPPVVSETYPGVGPASAASRRSMKAAWAGFSFSRASAGPYHAHRSTSGNSIRLPDPGGHSTDLVLLGV
jgi:hypothetical protein